MPVIQGSGATASYAPTTGTTTGLSAVLTVTAPDGITITTPTVTTTPAVTPTSFTATVPATQVGAYLLVWTVTGGTTTVIGKDQFSVVAPSLDLLSLTDLKDQINVAATDVSGNEKLRRYLISATDVVENITGPLRGQTRTEYFDGNRSTVVLLPRWVSAITSITEILGTTVFTLTEQPLAAGGSGQYGYTWDRLTNKITRRSSGLTANFPAGDGNVAVTYKMGITPLPQVISDAVGDLIEHWWNNGQTAYSAPFNNADEGGTTQVLHYAIPNAVMEKLEPYATGPALA